MSKNYFSEKNSQNDNALIKLIQSINFESSSDFEEEINPENKRQIASFPSEKNKLIISEEEDIEANCSLFNYSHIYLPGPNSKDKTGICLPTTNKDNNQLRSHAHSKDLENCSKSKHENPELNELESRVLTAKAGTESCNENAIRQSLNNKTLIDSRSPYVNSQLNFQNLSSPFYYYPNYLNYNQLHYIPPQIDGSCNYSYNEGSFRYNQGFQFVNVFPKMNPYYISYFSEPYIGKNVLLTGDHAFKNQNAKKPQVPKEQTNSNMKNEGTSRRFAAQYKDLNDFCANCKNHLAYLNSQEGSERIIKYLKASISIPSKVNFLAIILPACDIIMKNVYGHKVMSLFITYLDYPERKILWSYIACQIVELGVNKSSQNCISFLLDQAVDLKEQNEIGIYIQTGIEALSYDKIGNQILLKIALNFAVSAKKGLLDFICQNLLSLVYHSEGVCLVKTFVIFLKEKSSSKKFDFLKLIRKDIPQCLCDRNAHHFIMCMVENWMYKDYKEVIAILRKDLKDYSLNKFSSKIIIKILCSSNNVSLQAIK